MKKLALAGFLLAGIFGASAQTLLWTSTAAPSSNSTIGSGTSLLIGSSAGQNLGSGSTSKDNCFIGYRAGISTTTGIQNTFLGKDCGYSNVTGHYNVLVGENAGHSMLGSTNTLIGYEAGYNNSAGSNNVMLGTSAGHNTTGSSNIMIGMYAGQDSTGDNHLFIDNTSTAFPLIWGDFSADQLKFNGKVGIGGNSTTGFGTFLNGAPFPVNAGTANVSTYNLFVKGGILTDEIRVALNSTWADYVFANDYKLKPLAEIEAFVAKNKHLPNVPSAAQVKEEGINVAEMARIQQEKIEELTLYIIELNKKLEALEAKMNNK